MHQTSWTNSVQGGEATWCSLSMCFIRHFNFNFQVPLSTNSLLPLNSFLYVQSWNVRCSCPMYIHSGNWFPLQRRNKVRMRSLCRSQYFVSTPSNMSQSFPPLQTRVVSKIDCMRPTCTKSSRHPPYCTSSHCDLVRFVIPFRHLSLTLPSLVLWSCSERNHHPANKRLLSLRLRVLWLSCPMISLVDFQHIPFISLHLSIDAILHITTLLSVSQSPAILVFII